jgi:DNA-directed RNA polymerase specialized sigma24 family protein
MGDVAEFPTTRWSLVIAINRTDATSSLKALAELCEVYWYPLYAYARRRGLSPQDAEDRTQDMFRSLI